MNEAIHWFRKVVTRHYADFEGRARRRELWYYVLVYMICLIGLAIGQSIIGVTVLTGLFWLALVLPTIAVLARRLHDTGRSGWWLLIGFVPILGIVLIYWYVQPGVSGPNRYGADPKAPITAS